MAFDYVARACIVPVPAGEANTRRSETPCGTGISLEVYGCISPYVTDFVNLPRRRTWAFIL